MSDDNAYAESLFRTAKYRPEFPTKGFADLQHARWSGPTHNWSPIGALILNPERDCIVQMHSRTTDPQPLAA